jgi:hypothetical protein
MRSNDTLAAAMAISVALILPAALSAKGETTKITVSGAELASPIVITDPVVLGSFNVWSGAGTFQSFGGRGDRGEETEGSDGFIIDWPSGVVDERPGGLPRYEVAFYVGGSLPAYTVFYELDVSNERGYVYLPGTTDAAYRVNVMSIFRGHGFEGHWLRANLAWQRTAMRILLKTN